jgi:hypothetical protein
MKRSAGIWLGMAIMIVSETATLQQIEPFWSWNTPIAWTGFIIFADSVVYRARGRSWMRSAPREFAVLALVSIPLWVCFEFYNLFLRNWHYVGLPEDPVLRYVGYAWSFATIWPAIFEGADLVAVLRGANGDARGRGIVDSGAAGASRSGRRDRELFTPGEVVSIAVGAAMLGSPFVAPPVIRPYLAAPVWLGFILLLDPINRHLGGESLTDDLHAGRPGRLINLAGSGLLCGLLWEFWNYWSRAKWHYTVPIMENVKIFEMPVPGYLGFPAFALECFTMYVFLRCLYARSRHNLPHASSAHPIAVSDRCQTCVRHQVRSGGDAAAPCADPRRRARHAAAAADHRAREARHPGRRCADRPAHHHLADRQRRHRDRPEPSSSRADPHARRRRRP